MPKPAFLIRTGSEPQMSSSDEITDRWIDDPTTDSREVAGEYDELAAAYEGEMRAWCYDSPEIAADLAARYLAAGGRLLDAGCGTGLVGAALSRRGFREIDGADISTASLAVARRKGLYRGLRQVDLQQPLPFDDDAYDAVVCVGVLSHVGAVSACDEFCRIVRPGGHVLLSLRDDLTASSRFRRRCEELVRDGRWNRVQGLPSLPYIAGHRHYRARQITASYYLYAVAGQRPGAELP